MREPDIRCEWFSGCARPATVIASWQAGGPLGSRARSFCATHASLRASQDFAPARLDPLCRDPRPVSILCGAIAGALDDRLRAVIADYVAHGDPSPLLDLAEQRGLHDGGYGPERYEEWAERDAHGTGDNPHVWLPVHEGEPLDRMRRLTKTPQARRCPCGVFERESQFHNHWVSVEWRREYLGQWVDHSDDD